MYGAALLRAQEREDRDSSSLLAMALSFHLKLSLSAKIKGNHVQVQIVYDKKEGDSLSGDLGRLYDIFVENWGKIGIC